MGIKHNYTLLKPLLMVILEKEIKNVIKLRTFTAYYILMFYIFYIKIILSINKGILITRVGCRYSTINHHNTYWLNIISSFFKTVL